MSDPPDSSSMQSVVDALSLAIERPTLLDDPALVPLAYSKQWGVDAVRSESILGRGASRAVREALLGQDIASATDLVRTAPDPDLGMEARLCLPVRKDRRVLGYLWLLEPENLAPADVERVRIAARQIASLLASPAHATITDEADLIDALRSPAPAAREQAAADARSRGLLPEEPVALCLLAPGSPDADPVAAAHRVVRRLSVGQAISGSAPEGSALVAALTDPVLRMLDERQACEWILAAAESDVVVGQAAGAGLADLHEASHQATIALRLARSRQRERTAATWCALGADRIVAQLPTAVLDDVPISVTRMLSEQPRLVETLSAFLDAGGDVKATAAALSLHRSGVYYRLHQIETITGLDLANGDDRLLAHLAVRASRVL